MVCIEEYLLLHHTIFSNNLEFLVSKITNEYRKYYHLETIDHIKQIIAAQQSIARSGGLAEPTVVVDVMEQALDLGLSPNDHEWITIVRDYHELPSMQLDKHQVLQILVNLIRNAKQAMQIRSGVSHSLHLRIGFSTDLPVTIL